MENLPNGLREFLVNAKMNTYANNKDLAIPSRPNSKDIHFEDGDFSYIDIYLGSLDFIGQEAVWYKGEAIWGMNYFGQTLVNEIPKGFIACLKNALKEIPLNAPYRGPEQSQYEQFEYRCSWTGEVDNFKGTEKIFLDGNQLYSLIFHGGTLK